MTPFDHVHFAGKSDIGCKRKNNEDNFGMFPALGVWLVADGMGGGDDGEVASAAVVREVDAFVADCPPAASGAYAADDVVRGVEAAIGKASDWIFRRTREKHLSTCGSTVVGCVVDPVKPGRVVAFHAGDSRLYRLRGRGIKQITVDHSAAEMIGIKDESKVNPMFRGMVLRAVGVKPFVEIELTEFDVKEGDRVLICSDGLSRMVSDRKIASVARGESEPENAVAALIAAANEAGGVDNVTAVLVEFGKLPEPEEPAAFPAFDGPDATVGTADSETSDTGDNTEMTRMTMAREDSEDVVGEAEVPPASPPRFRLRSFRLSCSRPRVAAAGAALALALVAMVILWPRCEPPRTVAVVSPEPLVAVPTNRAEDVPQPVVPLPADASVVPPPPALPSPSEPPVRVEPPVVTNPPAVPAMPSPLCEPSPPAATNSTVVKKVDTPDPSEGCAVLAEQCGKENLATVAALIRRRLPADRALEFGEQMKRARASAQAVYRLKSAKASARFLVDLKYALQTAPEARQAIAARTELAKAWDCVSDGDVESVAVRFSAAKVLKEVAEALR